MKLIIMGTCAAFAGKNMGCSSYLLIVNEKNYLIDTGPGCLSYLQNYISYKDIDGIFLSHLHADHVSDIYTLRYAIYVAQRDGLMKKGLPIYMPKRPKRTFNFIRRDIKEEFSITEIKGDLKLDLNGLKVTFLMGKHPIPTYAMRFEYEGKTFVYTADTMYFDKLLSFCKDTHILIAEATLQNIDRNLEDLGHMTARRAGELARNAGVKRLILTHIWPEYRREQSLLEAQNSFDGEVTVGNRGDTIKIK